MVAIELHSAVSTAPLPPLLASSTPAALLCPQAPGGALKQGTIKSRARHSSPTLISRLENVTRPFAQSSNMATLACFFVGVSFCRCYMQVG